MIEYYTSQWGHSSGIYREYICALFNYLRISYRLLSFPVVLHPVGEASEM